MNQAMPQWRTLSSDGESDPEGAVGPSARSSGPLPDQPRWLWASLAAIGGFMLGGALVLVLAPLMGSSMSTGLDAIGEPLESLDMAAAVTAPDAEPAAASAGELVIDVAGAVLRPGLHRLRPGDRVGDAIAAAGGFGPRVDLTEASQSLNLAQPLEDGAKVLVPELGVDDLAPRQDADTRIDLNRASQGELESLPGIGPVTAGKIIAARGEARFDSVRELRSREVVGQSVFDDVKDLVRVSP